MPSRGRKENLKPKTSAQARGRLGGIQSGKAKRMKKLMSEIYADLLADQSGIKKGQGIQKVVEDILNSVDAKGKNARVSMIKELREGTEGSKVKTETVLSINTDDEKIQQILERHGIHKSDANN